jgi:hypothetical protein
MVFHESMKGQERSAALLERAYRMALLLQLHAAEGADEKLADGEDGFEHLTICIELVELLDEARSALVLNAPSPRAPTT